MVLAEALLHHMQRIRVDCHAFNRQHGLVGALQGQAVARFDGLVVDQHGASPALRSVTALVRAGQLALLAQHIDQQRRRRDLERHRVMVDVQREGGGVHRIYFNFRPEPAKACCVASHSASVSCSKGRRTGPPC